ncbi:hypothetical protein UFOVP184_48 [uncultured Caudovirales phage]|uniref:Uncharacterized protein n=1 Tax=uncultured Caudovirales phage TaxID=2100421 RepID=A0A6J7WDP4_9CAUD|nr:hypothetical protein UFOVP184_48 [uncultured Caudovirales phage]
MIQMNAVQALHKDRLFANRKKRALNTLYASMYRIDQRLGERFDGGTLEAIEATDKDRERRDLILERIDRVLAMECPNV